jgi:hypothetical protein
VLINLIPAKLSQEPPETITIERVLTHERCPNCRPSVRCIAASPNSHTRAAGCCPDCRLHAVQTAACNNAITRPPALAHAVAGGRPVSCSCAMTNGTCVLLSYAMRPAGLAPRPSPSSLGSPGRGQVQVQLLPQVTCSIECAQICSVDIVS